MKKATSFIFKRRAVYFLIIALFFGVPFIHIGELPLIRFDLSDLTIYFAGGVVTSSYIFTVLLIIFAFLFIFIYLTQVFGRIWCGWMCPQALSLEIFPIKDTRKKKPALYYAKRIFSAALIAFLATCGTIRYTMDLNTFITRFAEGSIHFAWWLLTVFIFFFILWGRKFCTTVCPYSMFQSIMFDNDTLRIGFIPETAYECIKCGLCARVCPAGIDIRDGLSSKCVSCAACVDACAGIMAKKDMPSLVGYFFGEGKLRLFKVNKLITLIIGIAFLMASALSFLSVKELKVTVKEQSKSVMADKNHYTAVIDIKNEYDENLYIRVLSDEILITDFTLSAKDSKIVSIEFDTDGVPNLLVRASRGRNDERVKVRLR